MKFKLERERGKGRQWLCVVPTHGEHVDAGLVRWLSVRHRNRLLDLAPKKEGVLRYDATGLTPLHEFLRQTELTSARYENLLCSIRRPRLPMRTETCTSASTPCR